MAQPTEHAVFAAVIPTEKAIYTQQRKNKHVYVQLRTNSVGLLLYLHFGATATAKHTKCILTEFAFHYNSHMLTLIGPLYRPLQWQLGHHSVPEQ